MTSLSVEQKRQLLAEMLRKEVAAAQGPQPVSLGQQALLYLYKRAPESSAYNTKLVLRISEQLDGRALRSTLDALVERHAVLRTSYELGDSLPMGRVAAAQRADFDWIQASVLFAEEVEERIEVYCRQPFNLETGPVIRFRLFSRTEHEHLLLVCAHHIAVDYWSLVVLADDLQQIYKAVLGGLPNPLPKPRTTFAKFAADQRASVDGVAGQKALAYWQQRLADVREGTALLLNKPRPATQTFRGATHSVALPPDLVRDLGALARRQGKTLYSVCLSAFFLLIYRYTGEKKIIVGSPASGRTTQHVEQLIGYFVNLLPLTAELGEDSRFLDLLEQVHTRLLEAMEYQGYPFSLLVEKLGVLRSANRSPLCDVLFSWDKPHRVQTERSLAMEVASVGQLDGPYDLILIGFESEDSLRASLQYNSDLFDKRTIEQLATHYEHLLGSVVAEPEAAVSRLAMVASAERARLIALGEGADTAYARDKRIDAMFAEQVQARPDAVAVECGSLSWTYHQLDSESNRIAQGLHRRGVQSGSRVVFLLPRSAEMIAVTVGILKAGCCYVPLDADYPAERLAQMLADTEAACVIALAASKEKLPATGAMRVWLLDEQPLAAESDASLVPHGGTATDLAYIMYTSGSTGQPKGVCVPHRAVVRLVSGADWMKFGPEQVFLQYAPVSFDAATLEIWGPLLHGGRLVVFAGKTASLAELAETIRTRGVTSVWLTAGLFHLMVDHHLDAFAGVKQLLAGGDVLKLSHVERVLQRLPDCTLINGYGPTENTTFTCCHPMRAADMPALREWTSVPIGRPIAHTQVYLLDSEGEPVPEGVPGELYAAGDGLADGYWRQPERTAEQFVYRAAAPGRRLYRTGDLARWRPDGTVEFLGRADTQVKLRGFRIEPGEIEAALGTHSAVAGCAVVVQNDRASGKQLVAYVVGRDGTLRTAELRDHLRGRLPEYMVPSAFVPLPSLPLTPNGKLDRRALPWPVAGTSDDAVAADSSSQTAMAERLPANELEQAIAAVWARALGREQVGREDNFFELGGHSLLLLEVHAQLQPVLGPELRIVDLFQYPTVRALAQAYQKQSPWQATAATVAETTASSKACGPIAIIGMSGRFPGAASVQQLWENLRAGVESIRRFSDEELRDAGVSEAVLGEANYVKAGADLPYAADFDASFFGMNPREAEITDPQHRLFLECSHEALERAGYDPSRYGGRIGVFAGATMSSYYANVQSNPAVLEAVGPLAALIGNDKDFVPSRVAYKLNLRGPAVNVQTACSTSLVAVHMACEAIRHGDCDMALAGGVSIRFPQPSGYPYLAESIMSPDGHCRPFDKDAHGTVGGNGVGVVLLKPLQAALADGDSIEAVILGSAINNDGSDKVGYTAPGVAGQAAVIAAAQAAAGVAPDTIRYIETHGTGTNLGDPIEVAALKQVFAGVDKPVALASIKSNIGHLDAAAGVTGLIKAALQLKHGELAPSLHFQAPNPKLGLEESPFFVNNTLRPWQTAEGEPRRAGVSSFGIGGTNAHAVLEQPPAAAVCSDTSDGWHILPVTAKTEGALAAATTQLAEHLNQQPDTNLVDVAYTLQVGRTHHPVRSAILCRTLDDAKQALAARTGFRRVVTGDAPSVVFLFPGQGSQYTSMSRDLYQRYGVVRHTIDECCEILKQHMGGEDLRSLIFSEDEKLCAKLDETAYTQPALFTVELALAKLWMNLGLRPSAMLGHSIGEYVAATLAGVWSVEDALRLVAVRGRLVQDLPRGSMLAASITEKQAHQLAQGELNVAAVNWSEACVLSGTAQAIAATHESLTERGVWSKMLRTSHAFHSFMLDPVLAEFEKQVASVNRKEPSLPWISNVTGTWIESEEAADPRYWTRHLRQTVRFSAGIDVLFRSGYSTFLEVGPGNTLASFCNKQAATISAISTVYPTFDRKRAGQSEDEQMLSTAASLWTSGFALSWQTLHQEEGAVRRRTSLPTYPFQRQRYWLKPSQGATTKLGRRTSVHEWFYAPSWQRSRRACTAAQKASGDILLVADTPELLDNLRAAAAKRWANVTTALLPAANYSQSLATLLLQSSPETPLLLVHAGGSVLSLVTLTQAIAEWREARDVRLAVLTEAAHEVTGDEPIRPEQAMVFAAAGVVAKEYPNLRCSVVDCESFSSASVGRAMNELADLDATSAIALRGKHRWERTFVPAKVPADSKIPLRRGGVYMITGATGGMAGAIARHLASEWAAKLVLVSRSAATSESMQGLHAELEGAGAEVLLQSADVSNSHRMATVFAEAHARFGPLHGIVHTAGVPGGALLPRQSPENLEAIFAPKVQGTNVLLDLCGQSLVDFVVLCSSHRSVLPAAGRSDYCAANAYLDAVACREWEQRPYPVISVVWDSWRESGMGVRGRASGESGPFSAELGAGLTDSEGVQAFRGALRTSLPVVVVSTRTFSDVVQENERLSADNLLQQFASSRTDTETKHARPNMRTEFVAPRSAQEELLARIWQDLLGLDRVGVNDNFFELGGDSVVSIQMIARAAKVRVRLTARQVFENQTISELAQSLGVHTGVQAEQGVVTGEAPPTPIQSWFFDTHSQTRNHFNQAMMLRLRTPVPAGVLAKACDALLAHHDSLRQRFEIVDGRWISRYIHSQEKQSVFQTCSLATVADADLPKAIEVEATQAHASLNVEQGPLMRVVYFDCGSHRPARLLLVVHHLAIDLASWRILVDDLQTACEQTIAGKSIVLPPKTSSFKSWAEQLRLHTVKGGFAAELTHWQTVESVDTVILVNACSTERQPVTTAAAVETYISAEQTTKLLHEVSTRFGAQPIEVLLTLLARTLHDWTGSSSFPVELEGLGREPLFPHLDVSRTTGWFTPLYPVLAAWNPSADWRSAIEANREHLRNIPHKGVGYGALRYFDAHAELGKRTPQIGFLYFGQTDQTQEHSTLFHRASEGCGVPYGDHLLLPHLLSVEAAITGGSLQIRWIYSQNQFEASTIQRLATFFERALEELLDAGVAQHTPAALAQDAEEFGWNDSDLDEIAAALQKTLEL